MIDASVVNAPDPEQAKLVAFAIDNTVVAAVVCANTMLLVPNVIVRDAVPVAENIPVVKLNPPNASVPLVNVAVPVAVSENAEPNVVVPLVLLIVMFVKVVLALLVSVPVPTNVGVKLVNIPVADNVNPLRFNEVAAIVKAVVPKSSLLNQLLVMSVAIEEPLINVKFGALVAVPPDVSPKRSVLVTDIVVVNPPVPDQVKLVAVGISNTPTPDDVFANTILFVPKFIERANVLLELNIPVVNVKPPRSNVPVFNVVVPVAANVNAEPNVVVPDVLIVKADKVVFPLLIIVPVPNIVAVKLVNVPPLLNVKLFKFSAVVPGLNAVVPKSSLLNQLPVVSVDIEEPLVNVKFGLLVALPPVVPKTNVLVTVIALVNPPVPVYVKPVAVVICNTVWPADVCANTILVVPKSIERVFELFELNIPTVKVKPPNDNDPLVNVAVPVATIENADPNVVAAA